MGRLVTYLLLLVTIIAANISESSAMTREQLKKTGKAMKNSCMPKNQVTEDMVGSIEQGQFIENKNVMCYIACIYQMIGVIKNGKLDYESSLKTVDLMFPQELKEPTKHAMDVCRNIGKKYPDLCEAAYWTARCMYDADSVNFFFP